MSLLSPNLASVVFDYNRNSDAVYSYWLMVTVRLIEHFLFDDLFELRLLWNF